MATARAVQRLTTGEAIARFTDHLHRQSNRNNGTNPTAATITTYLRDVREMAALTGGDDRVLDDIELPDLEAALDAISNAHDRRYTRRGAPRKAGRGQHSRARWVAGVRAFFAYAHRERFVDADPAVGLVIRSPQGTRAANRNGLSVEDAAMLRDTPMLIGTSKHVVGEVSARDRAILRLLTETGPRVSELVALTIDDLHRVTYVDGGQRRRRWVLRIAAGKGGKKRSLPLTDALVDMLHTYMQQDRVPGVRGEKALFLSVRGNRLHPRDVQRLVRKYALVGGTPDVTPHGLRHTALTSLGSSGVPVQTVSHIAGHNSVATTSIYLDASTEEAFDALDASPLSFD